MHAQYQGDGLRSGLGFEPRHGDRHVWCALLPDQLGPDMEPGPLAERPAAKLALGISFKLPGLCGVHVPAPCQALVQVLLVDAMRGREAASGFGRDGLVHTPYRSNLLRLSQATCYVRTDQGNPEVSSKPLENVSVETNAERRRRKLIELCSNTEGGVEAVAKASGLSAASLRQYMKAYKSSHTPQEGEGSRSERGLGDSSARAIEDALKLGRGWFDNDVEAMIRTPQEQELIAIFRQLNEPGRDALIENLRETRDVLKREAERVASGVRRLSGPEIRLRPGENFSRQSSTRHHEKTKK